MPKSGHGPEGFVMVGRVLAPVGLRGEVRIYAMTDVPQRFSPGSKLYLKGSPHHVLRCRNTSTGLVVQFREVTTRAHAEALRGEVVHVPERGVPPPPEDTYYHYQILGMRVFTPEGNYLGEVAEVLTTGSNDVYVVRQGRRETLVPAVSTVVLTVDVAKRRMTVDLPEGL